MHNAKKTAVLHLICSRGLYGAERVIINLIRNTCPDRFSSHLGLLLDIDRPSQEFVKAVRKNGGKVHILPAGKRIDGPALKRLASLLDREGIDILHCHGMKGRLYGLLCNRSLKIPLITTNHNWVKSDLRVRLYEALDIFYIRFFDRIVAVSEQVYANMKRYMIPKKKMSIILNGISVDEFEAADRRIPLRKEMGIDENMPLIGMVGRLSHEKGQRIFIDAARHVAAHFPNARFLIVGDGPMKAELQHQAAASGMGDKIIFTGFQSDVAGIYAAMDIFTLPSLLEGTPMALLEAMAAEKPVVAADVGGVGQILKDRKNGLLIPPSAPANLAERIIELLKNHKQTKELGINGKETVIQKYSAEKMAKRYEILYMEEVSRKSKAT